MKNLDIKYVAAQNFLCFGSDGIEITFSDHGNIVLVKGINLDVVDSDDRAASNGVGKSSIPEIIVYTLFGKTIKHPKKINHKDVINNKVGKGLRTEVRLGNLRIVRTRKQDTLRVWESDAGLWDDSTEITLGGQPATQKLIEDKIGLNYETFVNVVVFTDNNSGSFLESDAAGKREIVENLLSLEKYKNFAENAKNLKKEKKDAAKLLQAEYDVLKRSLEQCESREKAAKAEEERWRSERLAEIEDLGRRAKDLESEMKSTDSGSKLAKYEEAQSRIEELRKEIGKSEEKRSKVENLISEAQEKLDLNRSARSDAEGKLSDLDRRIKALNSKISESNKEVERLKNEEGATCKYCMGVVSKENYESYTSKILDSTRSMGEETESLKEERSSLELKSDSLKASFDKISEGISSAKAALSKLSLSISDMRKEMGRMEAVERPQTDDVRTEVLRNRIETVKQQTEEKKKELDGPSPFATIISSLSKEMAEKKEEMGSKLKELEAVEKELPYYEFWSVAFGDSGIRKFIIDGIIPALNAKVAHWLQFLIDGKISLEFNNELEERIERSPSDGDPFVYYAMSGGERRRLNLAVSQAFAHVMMLSCGTCPSLVFLDEVTTNIDQIGVVGVYNMIVELAKDRQVFITTHDQNLLEMLEGCELLSLEKKNGFTSLKKSG